MLFVIYAWIGLAVTVSTNGSDDLPPTGSSHCFKRISGGERLIGYDVTRIIERNSVGECEEECNIYKCTHFSFGNGTGGNGTCELTTDREISRTLDPNFDLYQRTNECAEGKPTGYEKEKVETEQPEEEVEEEEDERMPGVKEGQTGKAAEEEGIKEKVEEEKAEEEVKEEEDKQMPKVEGEQPGEVVEEEHKNKYKKKTEETEVKEEKRMEEKLEKGQT